MMKSYHEEFSFCRVLDTRTLAMSEEYHINTLALDSPIITNLEVLQIFEREIWTTAQQPGRVVARSMSRKMRSIFKWI